MFSAANVNLVFLHVETITWLQVPWDLDSAIVCLTYGTELLL